MRSHTGHWLRGVTPTGLEQSRGTQAEADVINVRGTQGTWSDGGIVSNGQDRHSNLRGAFMN